MFGHLLFFKENNIFDLIEMFKMRSANTPQLAKSCSSTPTGLSNHLWVYVGCKVINNQLQLFYT